MTSHLVIPDTQYKEGVKGDHLIALSNFIVEHQPDVIIHLGDHADMPSLSAYDKGKKSFEGRRYSKDIAAAQEGMELILGGLNSYNNNRRRNKMKLYTPKMILTLGNHENRINRVIEDDARLDGAIGIKDLKYEQMGWEVHPFLKPVVVNGITYVHYIVNDNSPHAIGRAHLIAAKRHRSITVGHKQGLDIHVSPVLDKNGKRVQCIIAGSYYMHEEEYMSPQGQDHWKGIIYKQNVSGGEYSPAFLSLEHMIKEYL